MNSPAAHKEDTPQNHTRHNWKLKCKRKLAFATIRHWYCANS